MLAKSQASSKVRKRLVFLVLVIFVFWGVKFYWESLLSPLNPQGEVKLFIIRRGEGVSSIADRLEQEGLVRSSLAFKLFYKFFSGIKIESGDFKLSPGMSTQQVLEILSKGSLDKWVTLLEGWRVEEMASQLNKELGIKNDEFLKVAKEGYMFPDTYLFNREATAATVVSIMRANFDKKYSKELQDKIKAQGLTAEEGVILASIVEREARSDEVRRMVASILLKRLKIGMGLQADATVQYIVGFQGGEKSWWKRHLTRDDLKRESRYNTYLHAGLPPAPISNPSLSSLKAVAQADSTVPYLYYYHDSKGNSYYAKTLEEHNDNVAKNI